VPPGHGIQQALGDCSSAITGAWNRRSKLPLDYTSGENGGDGPGVGGSTIAGDDG
jgi:hypothetical protein